MGTRTGERAVADDSRAQEGSGLDVAEDGWKGIGVLLFDDDVLGVTAVDVPSREPGRDAEVLACARAEPAHSAGVGEPRDADAITLGEAARARTEAVDDPDDFVAGRDAGTARREVALGEVQVGATDPAGEHSYSDLQPSGSGDRPVDEYEGMIVDRTGLVDDPGSHRRRAHTSDFLYRIGPTRVPSHFPCSSSQPAVRFEGPVGRLLRARLCTATPSP